jgi:ubiquitin-protein ligase
MHAMGYGVPVISNDDADSQMPEWEAIIPGKTGSYYRNGDIASLASAIEYWMQPGRVEAARPECLRLLNRFWNPRYQRQAIERAVLGLPADDLFDVTEGPVE